MKRGSIAISPANTLINLDDGTEVNMMPTEIKVIVERDGVVRIVDLEEMIELYRELGSD